MKWNHLAEVACAIGVIGAIAISIYACAKTGNVEPENVEHEPAEKSYLMETCEWTENIFWNTQRKYREVYNWAEQVLADTSDRDMKNPKLRARLATMLDDQTVLKYATCITDGTAESLAVQARENTLSILDVTEYTGRLHALTSAVFDDMKDQQKAGKLLESDPLED